MPYMNTDNSQNKVFSKKELYELTEAVKQNGIKLGFQQVGISNTDLGEAEKRFEKWLSQGCHGEMNYLSYHGKKRFRPEDLVPGTIRVISVRMDYWPTSSLNAEDNINDPQRAYIARYALGRDYHKVLRKRLAQLANLIETQIGNFGYRVFVDSAPVLEKPLAQKAGLGWIGKHTNLIHPKAGSWFFLGELYTDLPLLIDEPIMDHCGSCTACIDVCPTQAIVAPYLLDARRCISYLTIELKGSIPVDLRSGIGNRIFGCDDCQLVCPWNKFAKKSEEKDFIPRNNLDQASLIDLFRWSESDWDTRTKGSALRRAGYEGWLRNLAVALGNAPTTHETITALKEKKNHISEIVREHVLWALTQHETSTSKA